MEENKKFKPIKFIMSLLKFILKAILFTGLFYGAAFIVGILIYIFTGQDIVLTFLADVLSRIITLKNYI